MSRLARQLARAGTFVTPTPIVLTSAPDGGWCWFEDPRAIYNSALGKTIFGYSDGSNGDIRTRTYDHTTGLTSAAVVAYPSFSIDDHCSPAYLRRASDGHLLAFFTEHVGNAYVCTGTSPDDITSLVLANVANISTQLQGGSISPPTSGFTYSNPVELSDGIYLFVRHHNGYAGNFAAVSYSKSTDGGATWATATDVLMCDYHKIAQNGTGRIDIVTSWHPDETGKDHGIYHMYYQGGSFYKTDGTLISATKPFDESAMTQVYDGTTTYGWIWDIAIDGSGSPVIVFATFPGNDGSVHVYNYATQSGGVWTVHQIVSDGPYFPSSISGTGAGQEFYSGGVVLDHSDPTKVYLSRKVGSQFEIYRYETVDGGATWTSTPLTSSSSSLQVRPVVVRDHASPIVLWLDGTYTDYTNYSMGVKGFG